MPHTTLTPNQQERYAQVQSAANKACFNAGFRTFHVFADYPLFLAIGKAFDSPEDAIESNMRFWDGVDSPVTREEACNASASCLSAPNAAVLVLPAVALTGKNAYTKDPEWLLQAIVHELNHIVHHYLNNINAQAYENTSELVCRAFDCAFAYCVRELQSLPHTEAYHLPSFQTAGPIEPATLRQLDTSE